MTQSAPPPNASIAHERDDGKLFAPSAERNAQALTDVLMAHAPRQGRALEIASGTGQHVVAFARAFPELDWQPSELDPARRVSIAAWAAEVDLVNLRDPVALDAGVPGWSEQHGGQDLIVLVNLLHLVSEPVARCVIGEVGKALSPGGRFVLYGPFLRDGVATSDGDRRFHESLQAHDPAIGYKDDGDIRNWLAGAGLRLVDMIPMPANNLAYVSARC